MNGYLTIDLEGRNIGDTEQTPLEGLYNKVTKSKKPVVFFNYKIGDNAPKGIPFYANTLSRTAGGGFVVATVYDSSTATVLPIILEENDKLIIQTT